MKSGIRDNRTSSKVADFLKDIRDPAIAAVLHEINWAETKGSGIRTMRRLAGDTLSADEAKVLIYARETGLVDNMACRDFSGLDTLQTSNLLRRLRDRGLPEKQGAGNRTHYTLANPGEVIDRHPEQVNFPLEGGNQTAQGGKRDLPPLPPALAAKVAVPRQRMSKAALRQLIRDLRGWQARVSHPFGLPMLPLASTTFHLPARQIVTNKVQ